MRRDARENAFKLIFESLFHEFDVELSQPSLTELKRQDDIDFFNEIISQFNQNKDLLKEKIEKNLQNFEFDRLFKIDLAFIYLTLTEVLFCKTPRAVAINESLELAKKYSTEKSSKFINGLISAILNQEK